MKIIRPETVRAKLSFESIDEVIEEGSLTVGEYMELIKLPRQALFNLLATHNPKATPKDYQESIFAKYLFGQADGDTTQMSIEGSESIFHTIH